MSKRPPLPVAATAADVQNGKVIGTATTSPQAKRLVVIKTGSPIADVHIEKIGLDHLLNTCGQAFWQYTIAVNLEKAFTPETAIALLNLKAEFDLLDLKTAYREACKLHHPDLGGTEAEFIQIDRAYDFLKTLITAQAKGSDRWDAYVINNLAAWEQEFRRDWKAMCDRGLKAPAYQHDGKNRYGLWYSTTIERFARMNIIPIDEWFKGCIYSNLLGDGINQAEIRQAYRDHLLQIAPNKLMAEVWARRYFQLEFGSDVPWIFYLMPAKELEVTR